ncbi:hypothetical protein EST38_g6844 [Candolleomyces aberdarensis]|uniref:Uncharacterized protein n=1 Tax=Candolleomyces aberdarensis TaxID=2316362 RepID=A0A4Q2DGM1_9AGAR|nr:hypothetical protein EST38_g6844 [Candolleomyces aberdarensis]
MAPKSSNSTTAVPLPQTLQERPPAAPQPAPACQTSAQVKKDKEEQKAKKQNQVKAQQLAIMHAAETENRLLAKERTDDENADNPDASRSKPVPRRVMRPRPLPQQSATQEDGMDVDEVNSVGSGYEEPSECKSDEPDKVPSDDDEFKPERHRKKGEVRQLINELKQYGTVDLKPIMNAKNVTEGPSDNVDADIPGGISDDKAAEFTERSKIPATEKPARFDFVKKHASAAAVVVASASPQTHAQVTDTTLVPTFIKPLTANAILVQCQKKADIKTTNIPKDIPQFNEVFPHRKPTLSDDPTTMEIVLELTSSAVATFRNKFANQALKTLENVILSAIPTVLGVDWAMAWGQWVRWALSGEEHCRVFFYQEYKEVDVDDDANAHCATPTDPQQEKEVRIRRIGLFQSIIILSTLAVYYTSISTLPAENQCRNFPIGALILAIQAIECANGHWDSMRPGGVVRIIKGIDHLKDPKKMKNNIMAAAVAEAKLCCQYTTLPAINDDSVHQDSGPEFDLINDEM